MNHLNPLPDNGFRDMRKTLVRMRILNFGDAFVMALT